MVTPRCYYENMGGKNEKDWESFEERGGWEY